jgi:hypothetical protein
MNNAPKRGRPKGFTKEPIPVIEDPIIEPYIIFVEENCYSLYDNSKITDIAKRGESIGYYSNLSQAILKISKLKVSAKSHTLKSYISEYKEINDRILKTLDIEVG